MGAVANTVMEGICEMILLWPIPSAMVEFVSEFVDKELGIVVGIAYWYASYHPEYTTCHQLTAARYTYSVTFSALVISAGSLADYWGIPFAWKSVIYIFVPIALWAINALRVEVRAEILGVLYSD